MQTFEEACLAKGCITFVYSSQRSLAKVLIQQMLWQFITEGISLLLKYLVNHNIGSNFIVRTTKYIFLNWHELLSKSCSISVDTERFGPGARH